MKPLFGNLFGRSRQNNLNDFSGLHTDMHSHLIPGIDDGAQTIEDSLGLVKDLYHLGFRKLITTPHIMNDFYKNTPEVVMEGLKKLKEAVAGNGLPVTIEAAAEYYLDDGFEEKLKRKNLLTFGENYLLFEVSYINKPDNLKEMIFEMQINGYTPVLAHPERYPFWYGNFDNYISLKDQGVLFQLNINSISGYYSPATKKIAEKLIDNGMVDLLGTDAHSTKHIGVLKKTLQENYLGKLLNSGKLLNGKL